MTPRLAFGRVRGTPIETQGRILVPEARVFTLAARQATIGTHLTAFVGARVEYVRPTALIEQTRGGERRYPVVDSTGRTLTRMVMAAALIPVLARILSNRMLRRMISAGRTRSRRAS